ncbi:MAG: AAA family ATPase [Rhodococcus sp.]|nr:AAA family ATPase [Rhodococcus sp. (in: high G+C Gram-positive bacteria)]
MSSDLISSNPEIARQIDPPEIAFADELAFLAVYDDGPRPPGWRLSPSAVVTFVLGSDGALTSGRERMTITPKYVGDRRLVERCVVTLAGSRGLLLVGEPGTAKSMLSELLSAAICGTSGLTVQGTAGTTEDQLRYGWNYALLLAEGPSQNALVPSPVMTAMRRGGIARIEEITRCLPEVQDALVSVLSERRLSVPELGEDTVYASPGFALIATANLRDRGVSEMSAALKRRFNFEHIDPIADRSAEIDLVTRRTQTALTEAGTPMSVDAAVIDVIVTIFRDLRTGHTAEGWSVERPSTVLSTAEAVAISTAVAMTGAWFPGRGDRLRDIPGQLLGVVHKDDADDAARLLGYWDVAVKRRSDEGASGSPWRTLWEARDLLERPR